MKKTSLCSAGTPASQVQKGIDGLRCDFAQGLPSEFWEYCINKTRGVKWNFVFMAESLDGYRTTNGSKRHGVGYRSARHFDVLLSDIAMPEEDGYSLIRRIRSAGEGVPADIPAVAFTAYARPEDRVKALRSGFQMHLAKPIEPAELLAMIASLARR